MKPREYIAYFSMEIGLESAIPTYAGGLGVLAGDTIRAAADSTIPLIAISLLARRGYFHQYIDRTGWQTEAPVHWPIDDYLEEMPQRASIEIEGRPVTLRAWKYEVVGYGGRVVQVFFLDSDLELNQDMDRSLTHYLYGGDEYYRLCQEVILGIGGIRMLRSLGYNNIRRYHMNEGHASLLIFELLNEEAQKSEDAVVEKKHLEAVREQCVFTTHTPVPAGHDQFPMDLAEQVIGLSRRYKNCIGEFCFEKKLNLTYLALHFSRYVNGVAKRHREISQELFSGYKIDSITNGIHVGNWTSAYLQKLFDKYIRGWRGDNASLRYALNISKEEIWRAHQRAKRDLIEHVNNDTNAGMDRDIFTLGYARRATQYKRADLLFFDTNRLKSIADERGPMQIVFAGKAHPHDQTGKQLIQHIYRIVGTLGERINIVYLKEYNIALAKLITAGVDLWLNTPMPPMEASGTSGMKAAVNGVPSLSILDGWWLEGCIEGVTGWAIGDDHNLHPNKDAGADASSLYDKLENHILPMYYKNRDNFIEIMRSTIALNGSFFNTERMLNQYVTKAYF